jgi:hypothetical protein
MDRGGDAVSERGLIMDVMDLLARFRAEERPAEEKELLAVAINALLFITSTGQRYAFEDYLAYLKSDDPPPVVAAFDTPEEAEAWLKAHPSPPDGACVLIAGRYHAVVYVRRTNLRRMVPHTLIEYHLGDIQQGGLPPPVASFDTREEAAAWLQSLVDPPRQAVIRVAGEPYLAVYHRNVNHRALYPFSMAIEAEKPQGEGDTREP